MNILLLEMENSTPFRSVAGTPQAFETPMGPSSTNQSMQSMQFFTPMSERKGWYVVPPCVDKGVFVPWGMDEILVVVEGLGGSCTLVDACSGLFSTCVCITPEHQS
jgi:hypothetical protein